MNILFLHPNMPGQYKHLARALAAAKQHRIFFVTKHKTAEIPGVQRITYGMPKPPKEAHPHRYLVNTEAAIRQGQQVWRVANELKKREGFVPDIVVTHPGWGDALFIRDLFPNVRILGFCEFFYRATGADVAEGDWLMLDPDLPEASRRSGLSQYELLTGLGRRYQRRWT